MRRILYRCDWAREVWEGVCPRVSPQDIQFQDEMEQEMIQMIDAIHYDQHLVNNLTPNGKF